MNSSSFDKILRQVLIVPIVVVLLGAVVIAWQIHQANRTVAQIQRADDAIAETLLIERLVIDQETGLRGFQTTGDPSFLKPYLEASQQLPAEFARRSALLNDSPTEVNDLQVAHEIWEQGFAEPLIASVRAGAQTSDVELNSIGRRQMDDLRQRLNSVITHVQSRRDRETARWREQVRLMSYALVLLAGIIGIIIGLYTRGQLLQVSNAFRQSHNVLQARAEQTFRSEEKLRTTLQSIGDGVITLDAQGRVETLNDVAQQLTGWTSEQARTLPLESVFHVVEPSSHQPVTNPVADVQHLDSVFKRSGHATLIRKDASEIFINDSGAPIRDKLGAPVGAVLVFRDITMAVKSQDALIANEKLAVTGRLAATIAHEIHNPLDSVANLLFLMDGDPTPQETARFLSLAQQEIARVTQISRAMLSLHRESVEPVPVDLKQMLDSVLLLMEGQFARRSITVQSMLPDGLVLQGFPAELRQVFTNLLTNAAEASSAGGFIRLEAQFCQSYSDPEGHSHGPGTLVSISDHGAGIPEEVLARLFQAFYTTKGERGTGLGLWVSRGIISKHGGAIDISSSLDPAHHGTTVSVFLPSSTPHAA